MDHSKNNSNNTNNNTNASNNPGHRAPMNPTGPGYPYPYPEPEYNHPAPPPPYPGLPRKDDTPMAHNGPSAPNNGPPPMGFHVPQGNAYTGATGPQYTEQVHVQGATIVPGQVILTHMLSDRPTRIVCLKCGQNVVTKTETLPSTRTHLFAILLCVLCWPFSCLPYCIDSCMDVEHRCPNCNAVAGVYQN